MVTSSGRCFSSQTSPFDVNRTGELREEDQGENARQLEDGLGRQKWVKMNTAWLKIGLLEGTNSRSESRNLFGLEANAHEKNVRVRKHILCGVLSTLPIGYKGIAIVCERTTLKKTLYQAQYSVQLQHDCQSLWVCSAATSLPVLLSRLAHNCHAREFETVSSFESFCYWSPGAPEAINTWTYYAEPSRRIEMHSDSASLKTSRQSSTPKTKMAPT